MTNYAAPKALYNGSLEDRLQTINGEEYLFMIDSSAIGTTWKIKGENGKDEKITVVGYKDFRSDGFDYPIPTYYHNGYVAYSEMTDTITITEDMKYIALKTSHTNQPILSEVYKSE